MGVRSHCGKPVPARGLRADQHAQPGPGEATARNEEIVRNALAAAGRRWFEAAPRVRQPLRLHLRGHYPLEPDVIAATIADVTGQATDGVVMVPAFPDAGRVTIGGVHYMRGTGHDAGKLTPVAETEFAKDASFGFANSGLAKYVEEKSQGRFPASDVIVLDLKSSAPGRLPRIGILRRSSAASMPTSRS